MSSDFSQLTPFPVSPEVLAAIRPMQSGDCRAVGLLHLRAMGNSLWAKLGLSFLATLYAQLLQNPLFIAYVYEEDGEIGGFVAGTSDSSRLFSSTLRHSWPRLLVPVLSGLLRHPSLIIHIVRTYTYFARSDSTETNTKAESLFCSFKPHLRGKRIAGHINKVLFEHMLRLGITKIKITTETDNAGANRQLRSWGFSALKQFRFYGKSMVTYTLDLPGHPRLQMPAAETADSVAPTIVTTCRLDYPC